eukprot:6213170-Pleurochrysis_carterae.AAC.1
MPFLGALILEGSASGVTPDLRFERPYRASPIGLICRVYKIADLDGPARRDHRVLYIRYVYGLFRRLFHSDSIKPRLKNLLRRTPEVDGASR